MRLFQVGVEQIKPKEAVDLTQKMFENDMISKQHIRRGLVRLFWRYDDIILDFPRAGGVVCQIVAYLHLRMLIPGKIVTQIPEEIRE